MSEQKNTIQHCEDFLDEACIALDNIEHYFENKCCPTWEEFHQFSIAVAGFEKFIEELRKESLSTSPTAEEWTEAMKTGFDSALKLNTDVTYGVYKVGFYDGSKWMCERSAGHLGVTHTSEGETSIDRETFLHMVKTNNELANKAKTAEERIQELERRCDDYKRAYEASNNNPWQARIAELEQEKKDLDEENLYLGSQNEKLEAESERDLARIHLQSKRMAKLEAERDGARAALEDRDKMHTEELQEYKARMLRLEAEHHATAHASDTLAEPEFPEKAFWEWLDEVDDYDIARWAFAKGVEAGRGK